MPSKRVHNAFGGCFLVLFSLFVIERTKNVSRNDASLPHHLDARQVSTISRRLEFVPDRRQRFETCDDLFVGTSVESFNFSSTYWNLIDAFLKQVVKASESYGIEGHSYRHPSYFKSLHYLASRPHVRYICETGFNLGHSTFNYLTASEHTVIYSFDLGEHKYASAMSEYLSVAFPGRLIMTFGNSMKTVPKMILANANFKCDLIVVDGGHSYNVALSDLLHLTSVASTAVGSDNNTIVVLDDYPSTLAGVGKAWDDVRRWGYIDELLRCSHLNYTNGFSVGRVAERPKRLHAYFTR